MKYELKMIIHAKSEMIPIVFSVTLFDIGVMAVIDDIGLSQ